jgi:hypothetical protein
VGDLKFGAIKIYQASNQREVGTIGSGQRDERCLSNAVKYREAQNKDNQCDRNSI